MGFLSIADVRNYVADVTIEDNEIKGDLTFTDPDIVDAMKSAGRYYNSIPPLIGAASIHHLPDDTNVFLDGTAYFLFLKELNRSTKADQEYTAGGVTTNLEAKRIGHLKELIKLYGDKFNEAAKAIKITQNLKAAYAHFD